MKPVREPVQIHTFNINPRKQAQNVITYLSTTSSLLVDLLAEYQITITWTIDNNFYG